MTDYEFGDEPDIDYETPAVMPEGSAEALDRASWHMRMASMISTERDQITAVYKAEMERLQIRLQHRIRIFDDRIAWHEEPVSSLHLALLLDEPKRKSIELPYGTSKVRVHKTPRVEFTDKPATLAWAEVNHPEILGHTINVTGVKSIAVPLGEAGSVTDTNGEIIPGVQAVLDDPSWSVSYDSEES